MAKDVLDSKNMKMGDDTRKYDSFEIFGDENHLKAEKWSEKWESQSTWNSERVRPNFKGVDLQLQHELVICGPMWGGIVIPCLRFSTFCG